MCIHAAPCVGREWLGLTAAVYSRETGRCLGRAEDEIDGFQFGLAEGPSQHPQADAPSHLTPGIISAIRRADTYSKVRTAWIDD